MSDYPEPDVTDPLVGVSRSALREDFAEMSDPLAFITQFEGGHPATELLGLLGRSHALAVVECLLYDDQTWWRFSELEAGLDVSTNTLSARLDELREAGLVNRKSFDEVPPHVEYAATQKAADLIPVLRALREWAAVHETPPHGAAEDS